MLNENCDHKFEKQIVDQWTDVFNATINTMAEIHEVIILDHS